MIRAITPGLTLILGCVVTLAFSPISLIPEVAAKGQVHHHTADVHEIVDEKVGDKTFQVSRIVVKAKPEKVWHILTDYDNAPFVFPNLKKCQVLEDKGTTKIMNHVVHPSGLMGSFEYVLEVKEIAQKKMEWRRLRGAFKEVNGYWKLDPVDGGKATLVTYASHVNGGLFLPAPLIRRQVRIDMPGVMTALKTQAETSSTQIARSDLKHRGN